MCWKEAAMEYKIAVIKGDGVGPEVVGSALKVLDKTAAKFGHKFRFTEALAGGCSLDAEGVPLPEETLKICKESDAALLGAVGGPKWDNVPGGLRPERALLGLRSGLGLYANIRPAILFPSLKRESPLRSDIAEKGLDLVIVRELTGGIYFGERGRSENGEAAYDVEKYSRMEVSRIGRVAFETARKRRKSVVSVDKANVLESSRLWREEMHALKEEYPDVSYADMYVDNAAMQLVKEPSQFDVLVTSNMFGDILSDEASVLTGSIGLLPSASLGSGTFGLYEPIHGSAPDIAGKGIVNPLGTILSAAMLLKYSLSLADEAEAIESAVADALDSGARTADMAKGNTLTTDEMTERVLKYI